MVVLPPDRRLVWEIFSYAWTEIGIEEDECRVRARRAGVVPGNLDQVDRLFFRDVCASFAVESFLILPLMGWMLMPDWGYVPDDLRRRIETWHGRPYWRHWLNPLRILGYPMAVWFAWSYRTLLRRTVLSGRGDDLA